MHHSTEPPVRTRGVGIAPWAMAAAWTLFAFLRHDPYYDEAALFASAAMLFGAVWFLRWHPTPDWEPLRIVGFAVYAQAFISSGLSVVNPVDLSRWMFTPSPWAFSFATTSTFAFTSMFMMGVVIAMAFFRPKAERPGDFHLPDWLAWALAIATSAYTLASTFGLGLLARLGNAPTIVFKTTLVIALLLATQLVHKRSMRLPLMLIFSAQFVGMLVSSMLGALLLPARDFILTYFQLRKPFPWKIALALGALVLLLNPAKHAVRSQLGRDGGSNPRGFATTERAVEAWGDAFEQTWTLDASTSTDAERHLRTTLSRLDYNWASALVYTLVPRALPYEGGRTYEDIPLILIPRAVYPDKPGSNDYFRTRWTTRLGVQTWESAKRTSIAIPASGEAYWNFGWAGVLVVPLILGLAVGGLIYLTPAHPVGRAAYLVVLATSLTSFLDMLVWHIPQFVTVAITAVLIRLYVRARRSASALPLAVGRAKLS